jgi:hypothetical protein
VNHGPRIVALELEQASDLFQEARLTAEYVPSRFALADPFHDTRPGQSSESFPYSRFRHPGSGRGLGGSHGTIGFGGENSEKPDLAFGPEYLVQGEAETALLRRDGSHGTSPPTQAETGKNKCLETGVSVTTLKDRLLVRNKYFGNDPVTAAFA